MRIVRTAIALLALVTCAWFVLAARQAHDLARASAIISSSDALTPARATHAASLLDEAQHLNPDSQVKLTRAALLLREGRARRAIQLALEVTREEPRNIVAWDELARVSGAEPRLLFKALGEIRRLAPAVPPPR